MYIAYVDFSGRISNRTLSDYLPLFTYIEKKDSAVGLLLTINSEGGSASVSEIIYNKIMAIGKKKPVFAIIQGLGASGSYWIASAASKIFSLETSLIGSIGIINFVPNVQKLLEKIGVSVVVNKIGRYKDMMSPFREISPEETEKYEKIMNDVFQKFKNDVKERRSLTDEDIEKVADGEIFSAKMAKELGLIDDFGDLSKAADEMSRLLRVRKKVRTFEPRRPFLIRAMGVESITSSIIESVRQDLLEW